MNASYRLFIVIGFLFLFVNSAKSQGVIRGKITDANGETLIGVTVVEKANPSNGQVSDLDGNYSIKIVKSEPVVLLITYVGFTTIEQTFQLANNEIKLQNFVLKSAATEVKEVEIQAKAIKAADYYMENMKKKSATTIDYVSSETMRKTGDNNVSSAIARITGVSTSSTGFITVRGIGDRYVRTTINGATIPTLDPFTSNIKLDFIPANLVDNIIITKTASPDLPGNWAGAYISVETKDYPEKLSITVESQIGYNSQSTFKNVLTTDGSPTDWMGYDDGFRDRDHNHVQYINRPTQYQELCALGLKDYFAGLGVTTSWEQGTEAGNNYFKLGLIQLGLLGAAEINDPVAYNNALSLYAANYELQAFDKVNGSLPAYGKSFPNNWIPFKKKAPLNFSQSFGIGNQIPVGKDDVIGFLFGLRYGSSVSYDPVANGTRIEKRNDEETTLYSATQSLSKEQNGWSALLNLAYKFNPRHSIGLLFMPNLNGVNNTREIYQRDLIDYPGQSSTVYDQYYEERKQFIYQAKSEHYFTRLKTKVELNVSYTDGNSDVPDFKTWDVLELYGQFLSGQGGNSRFFRYLDENVLDTRIKFDFPIGDKPGLNRKFIFGASRVYQDRDFEQYSYSLGATDSSGNIQTGSYFIPNNDLEAFMLPSEFDIESYFFQGIPKHRAKKFYYDDANPANHTIGNSEVLSAFTMLDYSINFRWRASVGLRVENADLFADVYEYDKKGYGPNDFRRRFETDMYIANPGNFNVTKFLPSINIIYKLREEEKLAMNLRANYSRTTAYPTIREITETNVYDFELRSVVIGNSNLKEVDIDNFDVRWESFFKSGNSLSISGFYKDFNNHIELVNSIGGGYSWQNVDNSYVLGIEVEGKKNITSHLEFRANVALINSETNFNFKTVEIVNSVRTEVPGEIVKRKMFGQSPYVANAILSYKWDLPKILVTASYNIQGKKLVIASDELAPAVFELPRNVLDLKVTKDLGKHFIIAVNIRDILNEPVTREYDNDESLGKKNYDSFRWGTNYNLGLTYRL